MTCKRAFRPSLFLTIMGILCASSEQCRGQEVWTQVSLPDVAVPFSLNIEFPTADTGYATHLSDSLFRTTDGGQSWAAVDLQLDHPEPSAYGTSALTFFGPNGWLVVYEADSNATLTRLLKTTDYGFTWTMIPFDSSLTQLYIYFKSSSLGYLSGSNLNNNFLSITTNGGYTWQKRTLPPAGINGNSLGPIGQPNIITGYSYGASADSVLTYLSTDTGATWNLYTGAEMAYVGANTWITYNGWSSDNGKSWITFATGDTGVLGGIIADTLGHAMSKPFNPTDNVLYFTTDYGHSWGTTQVPFYEIHGAAIAGDAWYVLGANARQLYRSSAPHLTVSQTTGATQFQILTNPAMHFLQISLEETPDDIRIVDFLGRTVARYSTQGGAFSADVSGLPEGLYWVVWRDGAKPFVHLN